MKTKAELEAEINDLKVRVAELDGAVAAYQFALAQVKQETYMPANPYQPFDTWPGLNPGWYTSPNVILPNTTTYNFSE